MEIKTDAGATAAARLLSPRSYILGSTGKHIEETTKGVCAAILSYHGTTSTGTACCTAVL